MKISARSVVRMLSMIVILAACFPTVGGTSIAAELVVYSDSLAAGWNNWSWNTTANFANTSPVYSGTNSIAVTYTAAWGGLYLATNTAVTSAPYDTLQFWINGGSQGGQKLRVLLADSGYNLIGSGVDLSASAGAWTQVKITLTDLGNPAQIGGIVWEDTSGGAQPTFYLDQISFINQGITSSPGSGPALNIDTSTERHTISEGIYGMNFAPEELAAELRLPVCRWGGNGTTRYNWQNDTSNHASDWYFENIPEDNSSPSLLPDGSAADLFVEQNRRTNTASLITVPLIGWTPKARAFACGFSVALYGAQESTDPWQPDCGNGVKPGGALITGNNPADTSTQIGPDFVKAWINYLTAKYGTAGNGGVAYYDLDNEPMLWNSTHRDVHPQPTDYDEMRDRTYQYAPAVKAADPSAQTLGPVAWGWCDYFYSASDGCSIGADYQTHGNTPYVAWYLQQMQAYEQQNHLRILDYLDLHYYPQANGVALSPAGDASTQALRLRSTRSLWDPTYTDESWINDTVRLIPRMHDWVNTYYPGTKLALSEYNWGGLESINGALSQADVLGIFGREGLDLATLWAPPTATQPGAFAFRMYRNYDGAGHGFGEVSVQATSADQETLAIYAALRSADNALTVVVINKTANSLTSQISLAGFAPAPTATVYQYSAANTGAILQLADQPVTGSSFSATFPGNSITLFVMMTGGTNNQTITITKSGTGDGSVTSNPPGIDCGSTCKATYGQGTSVTLTTTPSSGSVFAGWSGACSGTGNCVVTMDSDKSVTATFNAEYQLTITSSPPAGGTVTTSPMGDQSGITCPSVVGVVCAGYYSSGTLVTLTASCNSGYTFSSWSGDLSGTTNPISVTMNGTKNIVANFTQNQYTLTVNIVPSSVAGSVSRNPDKATYVYGDQVTLTATAASGYTFYNWSGDASGATNPVTLTIDGNKTVAANFSSTSVTPTFYNFGNVKVKKSKTYSFAVKNNGKDSLSITSSTITGTDASMFTIMSGGGGKTIKPGKSLTIKVAFKPTSTGSKSANLEITSNDPVAPTIDIPLSGTGQ